jgi:hypothetical protein
VVRAEYLIPGDRSSSAGDVVVQLMATRDLFFYCRGLSFDLVYTSMSCLAW